LLKQAEGSDNYDAVIGLVQDSWHIAVGKIIDKEYALAEKYFRISGEGAGYLRKKRIYYLRMYLLSLIGEEQKAESVKQEYMQLVISGKLRSDEYLEYYWKWLEETVLAPKEEVIPE